MADDQQKQTPDPEAQAPAGDKPQEQGEQAQGTDEGIKDKNGQPGINKERHDREIAERDKKIAELEAKLDEQVKSAEGREEFKKEIEALKAQIADKDIENRLIAEGCRSAKAAKAVLADFNGDIAKLKEAMPFLFSQDRGTTGGKPVGAQVSDDDAALRKAAGLKK